MKIEAQAVRPRDVIRLARRRAGGYRAPTSRDIREGRDNVDVRVCRTVIEHVRVFMPEGEFLRSNVQISFFLVGQSTPDIGELEEIWCGLAAPIERVEP